MRESKRADDALEMRGDGDVEARLLRRLQEENASLPEGEDDDADLRAMTEALGSYRRESLEWAERKSAMLPSPLPAGARGRQPAWLQAPQWALGTVAFCACVVGGALYTHHQARLMEDAAAVLPAAPTERALAADNELLSSVDDALRGSVAPSERELGLTANDLLDESATTRRRTGQRSN